jgi:hypothetical protein
MAMTPTTMRPAAATVAIEVSPVSFARSGLRGGPAWDRTSPVSTSPADRSFAVDSCPLALAGGGGRTVLDIVVPRFDR